MRAPSQSADGGAPGLGDLRDALGLPLFIKPARQGSSVGVSKVSSEEEYEAALARGFMHDRKLLAEEFIRGREIECSVLEEADGGLFVSRPGEIVPAESHGFYSYDAKYIDEDGAALKVPAELPPEIEDRIRATAAKAFRAVGCDGMARVDFFLTRTCIISSTRSTPFPASPTSACTRKRWRQSGVSYAELIDRLADHGLARAARGRGA